jgi:hypothetical protein
LQTDTFDDERRALATSSRGQERREQLDRDFALDIEEGVLSSEVVRTRSFGRDFVV